MEKSVWAERGRASLGDREEVTMGEAGRREAQDLNHNRTSMHAQESVLYPKSNMIHKRLAFKRIGKDVCFRYITRVGMRSGWGGYTQEAGDHLKTSHIQ